MRSDRVDTPLDAVEGDDSQFSEEPNESDASIYEELRQLREKHEQFMNDVRLAAAVLGIGIFID